MKNTSGHLSTPSFVGGKTVEQWLAEIQAGTLKRGDAEQRQSFRNGVVQARVHRDRDRFIASISEEEVCRLASSYHAGDTCTFFGPPIRGSYNICYLVQFHSITGNGEGEKWVVRIPLSPCLAFGDSKLESEVATMQLIAERTTIPIPKIHAYALGDGPEPFPSFLILEYVEGRKLTYADLKRLSDEERTCFYTSLADMFIQLRRIEFSSIGCLTRGVDGFHVGRRVNTIDLNMQELEGLAPSKIQNIYYSADGTLTSTYGYTTMLLQIADNAFSKGQGAASREEVEDQLYHLHMFRQHATNWVDSCDSGPFILVHGDLEIFNLLLDSSGNVISFLDWEWSRVVPRQFFKPPLWLSNHTIQDLSYGYRYRGYLELFDKFLAILRTREQQIYRCELLAEEWDQAKKKSGFMVANALEHWTAMEWFANRYINPREYGGKEDLPERRAKFVQEDPTRGALVERKLLDWATYTAQLEQLNLNSREHMPDGKEQSISASRLFVTWLSKISLFPHFAIGGVTALITGASFLFGTRIGSSFLRKAQV